MTALQSPPQERWINSIIETVAQMEGRSPLDLPPISKSLDPDALGTLLNHTDSPMTVEFAYNGYDVTVYSDGRVAVEERH